METGQRIKKRDSEVHMELFCGRPHSLQKKRGEEGGVNGRAGRFSTEGHEQHGTGN